MEALLLYLAMLHPLLPWFLLTVAIWLCAYLVRKFLPKVWEVPAKLPFGDAELSGVLKLFFKVWQAVPSVLAGALLGAMLMGEDPARAWKGALFGAFAPVLHELRKALPFDPYQGATKLSLALVVFAVTLLPACSLFTKQNARTANDIARDLCRLHFEEQKPALSAEEIAETFCKDVRPWLDFVLATKRTGLPSPTAPK